MKHVIKCKRLRYLAIPVLGLLLLSCNLTNLLLGDEIDLAAGIIEEAMTAGLSDDRPGVMEELGRPDAFDISIVQIEGGEVRMESWRYFQYGTRVDFVDGEAVWTMEIDPVPDGTLFAAWYDPLAFEAGMTVEEASALATRASPAGMVPVYIDISQGGEDLAGGLMLAGDQILLGLENGRLVYVETLAMVPAGGE